MDIETITPPTSDMFAVVMRELTDTVGDPAATLQSLHEQLAVMWNDAGNVNDVDKQNAISQVYDGFMTMQQQTGTALNIAAAARELATQFQSQRDDAVTTHKKLVDDIRSNNDNNPLIKELSESLYETAEEDIRDMISYNGGMLTYSIASDIVEVGGIEVDYQVADQFFDLMTGELTFDGEGYHELRAELAEFMTAFVAKWKAIQ